MDEIKNCHYCGGKPTQSTFRDLNYIGEQGYKSVTSCTMCHNRVEMWAKTYDEAIKKSIFYWNGGKENE